jgi:predicted NBD/HSP70 family sugar kinase
MRLSEQGDQRAIESIERMAHYLGIGTAMLITSFAPRLIICVGEVTRVWNRVGPIVESVCKEKSPMSSSTKIIPLDEFAYPRLRGAVSLVLQKHFVAPSVA